MPKRREQPISPQTLSVPARQSRSVRGLSPCNGSDVLDVTVRASSRLHVEESTLTLRLRYAGTAGETAYLLIGSNTGVWIDDWHGDTAPSAIHIEIGPGACVGIGGNALAGKGKTQFRIVFASGGQGTLTVEQPMQDMTALELSGISVGDRINLLTCNATGIQREFFAECVGNDADLLPSVTPHCFTAPVQGLQASTLVWSENPWQTSPLPYGYLCCLPDAASHNSQDNTRVLGEPRRPAPLSHHIVLCHANAATAWPRLAPVIFEADALGAGAPTRRVALAPGQAIQYEGSTVLAHQLVNGRSVVQRCIGHQLCYIQPTALANADVEHAGLTLAPPTRPLAPYFEIERCRERLLAYTSARGHALLSSDPALRLELDGLSIPARAPTNGENVWRVSVPESIPADSDLRIVSRSVAARDTSGLALEDTRVLGVGLGRIVVHGTSGSRAIDLFHPLWTGLYECEYRRGRAHRWTNGLAAIPSAIHKLHGGETVELHITSLCRYWIDQPLSTNGSTT